MEKQVIIFVAPVPKVHSVRYDCKDPDAAVSTIYVRRSVLSGQIPKTLTVTIEDK